MIKLNDRIKSLNNIFDAFQFIIKMIDMSYYHALSSAIIIVFIS